MPYLVTEFEATPNPNAVKVWLDRPISDGPKSFLDAAMADDHPVAKALFDVGVVTVLLNGQWLTVNKSADANWGTIKSRVRKVLAEAD